MHLTLYLIIIVVLSLLGSLSISLILETNFLLVLGVMWLGIIIVIIIDGLTAGLCRMLPKKVANYNYKIYKVNKKEKKLLDKLQIKKWKDKIPEIGYFTGFRKNKIYEPKNPIYIERFLYEICYGELGHFISIFTGFLLVLIPWFKDFWIATSLYIAIVNGILNIFPIMVLRYNSYSLLLIFNRLNRQNKITNN